LLHPTHVTVRDAKVLAVFCEAVELAVWHVVTQLVPAVVCEVQLLPQSTDTQHSTSLSKEARESERERGEREGKQSLLYFCHKKALVL
jgi:hypothetical protein